MFAFMAVARLWRFSLAISFVAVDVAVTVAVVYGCGSAVPIVGECQDVNKIKLPHRLSLDIVACDLDLQAPCPHAVAFHGRGCQDLHAIDAAKVFEDMFQMVVAPVHQRPGTVSASKVLRQHNHASLSTKVTWIVTTTLILQNLSSGHANVLVRVEHRPPVLLSPGMPSVFLKFNESSHVNICLGPVKHLRNLRLNTKPQEVPITWRQPGGPSAGQSASTFEEALKCNRRGTAAGPRRLLPSLLCGIISEFGILAHLLLYWLMLRISFQYICSTQDYVDDHRGSWSWAKQMCTILCNLAFDRGLLVALVCNMSFPHQSFLGSTIVARELQICNQGTSLTYVLTF